LGFEATCRNLSEIALRWREFRGSVGWAVASHNKVWLVKRIAWRLQAQAEGDLSERARQRAAELAADADLRLSAPTAQEMPDQPPTLRVPADERMPRLGTVLSRRRQVRTEVHAPSRLDQVVGA